VQVDPSKPTLKPPGTKRLKLKHDTLLSSFAFKFNVCRYTADATLVTHTMTLAKENGACKIEFDGTSKLWDDTSHGRKVIENKASTRP